MTRIRHITTMLLGIAFTFNSFGFIFYFLVVRENLKVEAFEEIAALKSRERMETLSFSLSDLEKGNIFERINKKEIRYQGKMYDIVKEEKLPDKIIFYCVHDEKEDELEKGFSKNLQKNFNQKSVTNTLLHFTYHIQCAKFGTEIDISSPIQKTTYLIFLNSNYFFIESEVITPPPKFKPV